jgi:nitrite reductase/ring-hydroxylating ferredoxin subunit
MESCETKHECNGRREFLVRSTAVVGGLMLALSSKTSAQTKSEEVFVKIDGNSGISKIGGFTEVKTGVGKVVVVRTSETEYKAFRAKCPHKGGPIKYDETKQTFHCDWHDSFFDQNGVKKSGPSKENLRAFNAVTKAVLSVTVSE